jgi:hypothetical protein
MSTKTLLIEDLSNGTFRETVFNAPALLHIREYSNLTRPSALLFPAGFMIWNTSDVAPNYSDGAGGWVNALGVLT